MSDIVAWFIGGAFVVWACFLSEAIFALRRLRKSLRDDLRPIDVEWLRSVGFSIGTLGHTRLLPPIGRGAIVEMWLETHVPELDRLLGATSGIPGAEWFVSLNQGLPDGDDQNRPDDHVALTSIYPQTRGELRRLCQALGAPLP
jgi:hypothetical protein